MAQVRRVASNAGKAFPGLAELGDRLQQRRGIGMAGLLEDLCARPIFHYHAAIKDRGSVSKVEMVTPMALIYIVLFPPISTFETPPDSVWRARADVKKVTHLT